MPCRGFLRLCTTAEKSACVLTPNLSCQRRARDRVEPHDQDCIAPSLRHGSDNAYNSYCPGLAEQWRALRMAELASGSRDEALDLVQDAMFGFVRHYGGKPAADWTPLFYRVLDSRLNDWHRRRQVRGRWLAAWLHRDEDDESDAIGQAPDANEPGPLLRLAGFDAARTLDSALGKLPQRQRQAFLLRVWEGLDVAATATAMRCSEGSVKTHLFRALAALRRALEDHA
jgi:RNA polymerase sigma-70 factor (ECF subfamily)